MLRRPHIFSCLLTLSNSPLQPLTFASSRSRSSLEFIVSKIGLEAPCEMYFTLLPWDVNSDSMITYDGILLHEAVNPEGKVRP